MTKKKAYARVMLAAVLWGLIGLFVRGLTGLGFSRMQIVFLRVAVAAAAMVPVLCAAGKELFRVRLRDVWCFAGTGIVSLMLFNLCYFSAMQYTTLSVAAVLLYTAPAFVMLLSAPLFGERLTPARLGALALVMGGCVLVTGAVGGAQARVTLPGVLYGLGAGLGYALYSIFGRFALNRGYHTLTITFYTFLFALAGCLPFAGLGSWTARITPAAAAYAAGVGILCCVLPYLLYTKGLEQVDNGTASLLATLEPAVATLVSVFAFGEPLAWYTAAGIALLFAGIALLARARPAQEKAR